MSEATRDPQTQKHAALTKGGLAAAAVAVVAAFFPDVDAAKALAAVGFLTVVTGYAGSAARDWSHKLSERDPAEEGGVVLWLMMRLG